ncbi:hypothetical protein ACFRCQ_15295 [Cytobacillus firmus]
MRDIEHPDVTQAQRTGYPKGKWLHSLNIAAQIFMAVRYWLVMQ